MASTYLSRSNGTPTSQQIFTFSAWVKRGNLNSSGSDPNMQFFSIYNDTSNRMDFRYQGGDTIDFYHASSLGRLTTNRLFRDTNAWYHIVLRVDTTQSTSSDRYRLYINGVQETSFSTETQPSQNANLGTNFSTFSIGDDSYGSSDYDGSMAHIHYTDGQSYAPTTFGETDATTGIWKPKTAPSVTYGTNGFFLKFENSGAFGTDSSGNANTFTVNGTMTQTIDTPSNVFATWNPLVASYSAITYSNGNLKLTYPTTWTGTHATLGASSGKYYWEIKINTTGDSNWMGVVSENVNMSSSTLYASTNGQAMMKSSGDLRINNSETSSYGSAYSNGDIMGIAIDLDSATKTIQFYKNGTTNGSLVNLPTNMQDTFIIPFAMGNSIENAINHEANFGNGYFGTTAVSSAQNPDDGIGIFEYDVPAGYYALNTKAINAQEYD